MCARRLINVSRLEIARRILLPVSLAPFQAINQLPCFATRTPVIRSFSFSTACLARRSNTDKVDLGNTEKEEDDDDDDEDSESDQNEQEQIMSRIQRHALPKGYKVTIRYLASLRLDLICAAGTGMGRSAIEDEFYGSKLRVNGEKSSKKAQQVKEGDVIDLVVSRTDGSKYNSKRIIVYKIFDIKSIKNKVKVCLIAWRQGIEVDGSRWN